jgi:hypothetical protein
MRFNRSETSGMVWYFWEVGHGSIDRRIRRIPLEFECKQKNLNGAYVQSASWYHCDSEQLSQNFEIEDATKN